MTEEPRARDPHQTLIHKATIAEKNLGAWLSADECDAVLALVSALRETRDALERIKGKQPETIAMLRKHGVVFDGPLGADPKNFQHVAFSIYCDLCEVDLWARHALEALDEAAVL